MKADNVRLIYTKADKPFDYDGDNYQDIASTKDFNSLKDAKEEAMKLSNRFNEISIEIMYLRKDLRINENKSYSLNLVGKKFVKILFDDAPFRWGEAFL